MINLQQTIKAILPYVLAVIFFFIGKYVGSDKKEADNVNIETMQQLQEAELNNLRLEHKLEIQNIQIHYEKIKSDIDTASPIVLDSLFTAYGI